MTTRPHIVIARQNDRDDAWLTLFRNPDGRWDVWSATGASLPAVVTSALKLMQERPSADLTFSTRRAAEISAQGLVDDPATLERAVASGALTAFVLEGRPGDNSVWNVIYRAPMGGGLSAPGIAGRFRGDELQGEVLAEKIRQWFARENYESFMPPHWREAHNPVKINRPHFVRELLVRRDWKARELVPHAFERGAAQVTVIKAQDDEHQMQQAAAGRFMEAHS